MANRICKNCKYFTTESKIKNYGYGSCDKVTWDERIDLSEDSAEHVKKYGYDKAWHDKYDGIGEGKRYDENGYDRTIKISNNQISLMVDGGGDAEVFVGEFFGCIYFEDK